MGKSWAARPAAKEEPDGPAGLAMIGAALGLTVAQPIGHAPQTTVRPKAIRRARMAVLTFNWVPAEETTQ
jgi:hypothetical protein